MNSQSKIEQNLRKQNEETSRRKAEEEEKWARRHSVGKWIADNIVAILALIVSVIALIKAS